jgi:hypothetical protein
LVRSFVDSLDGFGAHNYAEESSARHGDVQELLFFTDEAIQGFESCEFPATPENSRAGTPRSVLSSTLSVHELLQLSRVKLQATMRSTSDEAVPGNGISPQPEAG